MSFICREITAGKEVSSWALLHRLQSPQGFPRPSMGAPYPLGGPYSITELLKVCPKSASPGLFPTMTLPFCFSMCISSHFSSTSPCCASFCSRLLFCVLTYSVSCLLPFYLLCLLMHLFLGLLCATATTFRYV